MQIKVNAKSVHFIYLFLIYVQEKEIRYTDQQKTNCARCVWQINSNAWTLVRVWTYDLWPLNHWPSQDLVMLLKMKPDLHSHRYEPIWLIQPWPSQSYPDPHTRRYLRREDVSLTRSALKETVQTNFISGKLSNLAKYGIHNPFYFHNVMRQVCSM